MAGDTEPSQTLLADAPLRLGSRRRLAYPNGDKPPVSGGGNAGGSRTGKRRAGSPLQDMPDLSQTQEVSQVSPSRSESSAVCLDSPQSSDSTLIEDSQMQKSPVFPLTGCRAAVHVDRLDQDLVETCRNSGFVLCSQDSYIPTQMSAPPRSPTFPQSDPPSPPKRPAIVDVGRDRASEAESPVFGRNARQEKFPVSCEKSRFFSSQETLTPSVESASCRPCSPVFPRSPPPSHKPPLSDQSAVHDSPNRGQADQSRDRSTSPTIHTEVRRSESPTVSREELRCGGLSAVLRLPESVFPEELKEKSRDRSCADTELTSDMTLLWSDEDEVLPVGSPSPVFPAEDPLPQAASQNQRTAGSPGRTGPHRSPNPPTSDLGASGDQSSSDERAAPGASSSSTSTTRRLRPQLTREAVAMATAPPGEPSAGQTVHYYWGVPFCPRGLDPDVYTQVILAQMKVYESGLKQAQRCLLRKAEWGEAILPQPEKSPSPEAPATSPQHHIPRRRGLRLRGRKTTEAADSLPAEAEEGENGEDEEELRQDKEEEEKTEEEEQMNTDDCEVCPETQMNDDNTQDLLMDTRTQAEPACKSPELPEIEMILQEKSPAGEEPQQEEEDASADEKMEISVAGCSADPGGQSDEEKEQTGRDVEELKEVPDREPAASSPGPIGSIACPMCQASFPASQIEMHAAYCDGEVAVLEQRRPASSRVQESLKPRRKRCRRAEGAAEETSEASNSGRNQEKCYICQKWVSLREYSRHTELCYQRPAPRSAARGNLLSALEQTESRSADAGPSRSRVQPQEVIDLRDDDDDDEEEAASAFRISNSPIRSFTPISEATDCLIDFKKQHQAKKPSQRRR